MGKTAKQFVLWATLAAIVIGVLQQYNLTLGISAATWMIILAIAGLIAGFISVMNKSVDATFLIVVITLTLVSSSVATVPVIGALTTSIAKAVLSFIAPVALVSSLGKLVIK